jgi:hypothetical protein
MYALMSLIQTWVNEENLSSLISELLTGLLREFRLIETVMLVAMKSVDLFSVWYPSGVVFSLLSMYWGVCFEGEVEEGGATRDGMIKSIDWETPPVCQRTYTTLKPDLVGGKYHEPSPSHQAIFDRKK